MNDSSVNKAWEFECVLENGQELKSWFYSDTKQDASNRVKNFIGAKLISIKEINDPLEIRKKQAESDKIRAALAKKKQEEYIASFIKNACSTTVAVVDVTGSAVVYAGKTIVNTVDMLTPDIINKK